MYRPNGTIAANGTMKRVTVPPSHHASHSIASHAPHVPRHPPIVHAPHHHHSPSHLTPSHRATPPPLFPIMSHTITSRHANPPHHRTVPHHTQPPIMSHIIPSRHANAPSLTHTHPACDKARFIQCTPSHPTAQHVIGSRFISPLAPAHPPPFIKHQNAMNCMLCLIQ